MKKDKLELFCNIIARMCMDHKAEFDVDCVHVEFSNGYGISYVREKDNFEIFQEVIISGGYHEPDDVDIRYISLWNNPWNAVKAMLEYAYQDEIQCKFESITMDIVWHDTEEM